MYYMIVNFPTDVYFMDGFNNACPFLGIIYLRKWKEKLFTKKGGTIMRKAIVVVTAALFLATICSIRKVYADPVYINAEATAEYGEYDQYTDTDVFLDSYLQNDESWTIYNEQRLIIDDDIVSVVPKELFFMTQETTYIGKQYGFYIETHHIESHPTDYYVSKVFVFDIEVQLPGTINIETKHSASIAIIPVFSYSYTSFYQNGLYADLWEATVDPSCFDGFVRRDNLVMDDSIFLADTAFSMTLNPTEEPVDDPEYSDFIGWAEFRTNGTGPVGEYGVYTDWFTNGASILLSLLSFTPYVGWMYTVVGMQVSLLTSMVDVEEIMDIYEMEAGTTYQMTAFPTTPEDIGPDDEYMDYQRTATFTTSPFTMTPDGTVSYTYSTVNQPLLLGIPENGLYKHATMSIRIMSYPNDIATNLESELGICLSLEVVRDNSTWANGVQTIDLEVLDSATTVYSYGQYQRLSTPISENISLAASITTPNENEYYEFVAVNSGSHIFQTMGAENTEMRIYDVNNNLLAYDDNSGSYSNAMILMQLTAGVRYRVVVNLASELETGYYCIKIKYGIPRINLFNNNFYVTTSPGESNLYQFITDDFSGVYVFKTSYGSIPHDIYVFDENMNIVASVISTLSGGNYTASLSVSLNGTNTTYYVAVQSRMYSTNGSYYLSVKPTFHSAAVLNTNYFPFYNEPGQQYFTFTPTISRIYYIETYYTNDTYILVYNSTGTMILAGDDDSGEGLNAKLSMYMIAGSSYNIRVIVKNDPAPGYETVKFRVANATC